MIGLSWSDLVVAVGLLLLIEGLAYAAVPDAMRALMARVQAATSADIRSGGLFMVAIGLVVLWLERAF